jgi:hypothetical protein
MGTHGCQLVNGRRAPQERFLLIPPQRAIAEPSRIKALRKPSAAAVTRL